MAIVVPGVAVNYPSPVVAVKINFGNEPSEGRYQIPYEIDWGSMGGTSKVVGVNLQTAGGTKQITQVCALHVDNSQSGADVQFVFTDTQETYTVPAYSPNALFPVFTRSTNFYVISQIDGELVETTDVTRFSIFNFVPPPVVIPTSPEQDSSSVNNIATAASSTTVIIPAGTNGTINSALVSFTSGGSGLGGGGVQNWTLSDGSSTPRVIAAGQMAGGASSSWNVILFNQTGINLRFNNGLNFTLSGAAFGGTWAVNVGYRQP
jgi:hypothetical protein